VAVPPGVVTDRRPDATAVGTAIVRLLGLADVTGTSVTLSFARSFAGVGSKLDPLTVTEPPLLATAGVKPLIVGAVVPAPEPTVTPIGPVVAPTGTLVTISVVETLHSS